jgi:hypothetical protein
VLERRGASIQVARDALGTGGVSDRQDAVGHIAGLRIAHGSGLETSPD